MSKEWDKQNMKSMAVNMKKDEAEAFKALATERGTTVGAMLRGYIQGVLAESNRPEVRPGSFKPWGLDHVVSYKNVDRLKREVAFYNPKNLNPDQMLNEILDQYFEFAEQVRKKSN